MSVEPALVDLEDLCDVCRAKVANSAPKRKRSFGEKLGAVVGAVIFAWVAAVVIGILTLLLVRLA